MLNYQRVYIYIYTLVGALEHIFSPIYWEFHHPNWRTHIFQGGRYTTSQFQGISPSFSCSKKGISWHFESPHPTLTHYSDIVSDISSGSIHINTYIYIYIQYIYIIYGIYIYIFLHNIWHSFLHILWHYIWDFLSGIYFDILSVILRYILTFCLAFCIWHSVWHSLWHGSGSRDPLHPELAVWLGSVHAHSRWRRKPGEKGVGGRGRVAPTSLFVRIWSPLFDG